jgi:hypothetical protein
MRSPIVRAIGIFAVVAIISWLTGWLLVVHLPANRTSLFSTLLMLSSAVLAIGGPIIGLFLAISHYHRNIRDPVKLPTVPLLVDRARMRRRRATIFAVIGIPAGVALTIFFGGMVISAAWLAGGGDMPPGQGNPSDMLVGRTILYVSVGMAAAGVILSVTSLVLGIGLLLTREKNRGRGFPL